MDKFFGGNDPFDHPFFTQPFSGFFGGKSPFDDPFSTSQFDNRSGSRKQITIEEMNPNDDDWQNNVPNKELSVKNSSKYPTGVQSFSFQRVAYGGPDGIYYTSSVRKRNGGDGVFLMEMKEEDRTVGESLHTVSKGIHDKGHSVTTKQCSDGRVDSLQTLHNLEQDELTSFEENWKTIADNVFPGWSNGFNLLENSGDNNNVWDDFGGWSGWSFPTSLEYYGNGDGHAPSHGTSTKIVPVE